MIIYQTERPCNKFVVEGTGDPLAEQNRDSSYIHKQADFGDNSIIRIPLSDYSKKADSCLET